jgi:putative FmdB family regulatory protein
MPFYRYRCSKCGHEFRVLHLKDVKEDVSCPLCEGADVRRLLSRVSVQFKGSGYYKTDRANKKSKAGTKGTNDKDTSTESSSKNSKELKNSKSDKPAKSSEPK